MDDKKITEELNEMDRKLKRLSKALKIKRELLDIVEEKILLELRLSKALVPLAELKDEQNKEE